MAKRKQIQFRPEQLPPRALELGILAAAIVSAIIAAVWKNLG